MNPSDASSGNRAVTPERELWFGASRVEWNDDGSLRITLTLQFGSKLKLRAWDGYADELASKIKEQVGEPADV